MTGRSVGSSASTPMELAGPMFKSNMSARGTFSVSLSARKPLNKTMFPESFDSTPALKQSLNVSPSTPRL